MSELKIGLALGGGGARGFCHVGVLKALEENGIKPYAIAGTSMGAVVGGIYASGLTLSEMDDAISQMSMNKIADLNIFQIYRGSFLKGNKVRKMITNFTKVDNIEDCIIKFGCVSFDVNHGKKVEFTSGSLDDAIYASMAVPTLFKPLEKDGMRLIDGGVVNNLPHDMLKKMGCNLIICVDATGKYDGNKYKKNIVSNLVNILNIFVRQQQELLSCDDNFVITPNLNGIINFAFNKENAEMAIKAGYRATKRRMKELKNLINNFKE